MSTQVKVVLGGIAAALIAIVTAYFIGLSTGSAQLETQRAVYEERHQDAMAELVETQQMAAGQAAVAHIASARADVYEAVVELDRRNFGNANNALRQAAQSLQQVDVQAAGINAAAFNEVRQTVERTSLIVVPDIELQRNQLLRTAQQLEGLVGR